MDMEELWKSLFDFLARSFDRSLTPDDQYDRLDTRYPFAHGTTILALGFAGGVVITSDRRTLFDGMVANRRIDKVHALDPYMVLGFAGATGVGKWITDLLQIEFQGIEKETGTPLSTEGKVNRLSAVMRDVLPWAAVGLAAYPLVATYNTEGDSDESLPGRIFGVDVTGRP